MNKIIIIGCPGSGKSTLASKLGYKLNIPVYRLDDWQDLPIEEFIKKQNELMLNDKWILDGNFTKTIENRLVKADTVIFLDYPRRIIYWRIIKRYFEDLSKKKNENSVKVTWSHLKYAKGFPSDEIHKLVEGYKDRIKIIIINRSKDLKSLLS